MTTKHADSQRDSIVGGFQLEAPCVLVPWGIRKHEVVSLLPRAACSEEKGLIVISCQALNGLRCTVIPRFVPRDQPPLGGQLKALVIVRPGRDEHPTFDEFQEHLEMTFGQPTERSKATPDWPGEYRWRLRDVVVDHHMEFNVGPRERITIKKA